MNRLPVVSTFIVSVVLSACQSSNSVQSPKEVATFCDRLIGWQAIEGEAGAERAITRAEVCAKPANDGVWVRVSQVHSKFRGRSYWILLPRDDRHIDPSAGDGAGWTLQARPFKWAHEIVAVQTSQAAKKLTILPADECPRKATGKSPQVRYCLAEPD